ncbi:hypothetical protein GCM10007421_20310 [Halopseudomonas oceani]|jgi:hypothetical protein|uniref:Tryptophan synthase subunit beta like protein n=1 Tax=Halopseudomonas oceani TaxID=1708783 RepID=A0A2P4EV79_9GAMM|nr:tryptophan synthase subunit beta like protein [Halopseudomonas oceani]POB03513.1 tryptophan synthase subunit beta like protein [Halopseudomonas oceani]GGE46047.1 hypothetical protein GCM10007421_20310 [Halopseudomonas oceani]
MYVKRDPAGMIAVVSSEAVTGCTEWIADDAAELLEWQQERSLKESLQRLQGSDTDMIRVLEDLIEVLLQRGVIRITDLPGAAVAKLNSRSAERAKLSELSSLIDQDEVDVLI